MYLAAIMPPSNIRRIIYDWQLVLFQQGAAPAALALPPHLPLAFYEAPPAAPNSLVQHPFESTGTVVSPPWRFIEFEPEDEIRRLRSYLPESETAGWYPTCRGIPLSAVEAGSATGGDAETDPAARLDSKNATGSSSVSSSLPKEIPPLRWKTSHLVCMNLETDDEERWWEHLEFTVIWRVKLKRKIE